MKDYIKLSLAHSLAKIFKFFIIAVFLFVFIYFVMDYTTSDAVKKYTMLSKQIKVSSVASSKAEFKQSYMEVTNSISEKYESTVSEEKKNENPKEEEESNSGGGVSLTPWTSSTAQSAINVHCSAWGTKASDWAIKVVNGATYLVEAQNKTWEKGYNCADASSRTGSTGSIKSLGCMNFAMAAAASICTGKVVGVEDILIAEGYNPTFDSDGNLKEGYYPKVGMNSSYKHPSGVLATPADILGKGFGVKCQKVSAIDTSEMDKGNFYIVHAINDAAYHKLSSGSGGEHWFLVVAYDSDNYYFVNGKNDSCDKKYTNEHLNHIYLVKP